MSLFTPFAFYSNTASTPFDKALSFAGSNANATQNTNQPFFNPLRMGDVANTVAAPSSAGQTSSDTNSRPWSTAVIFQSDLNSSNQHIWNQGEGSSSTDDNVYLRMTASGRLLFGIGTNNSKNECFIETINSTTTWYGIYIGHNGTRYDATNATAANLAGAFDIYLMSSSDNFQSLSSNYSTSTNWTNPGSNGATMANSFTGNFSIGGRGTNRNFHGDITSMITNTLKTNAPMPTTSEAITMIKDPISWVNNYKLNEKFRPCNDFATSTADFALNAQNSGFVTQVWLNGDGTTDTTSIIYNYICPSGGNAAVNFTRLDNSGGSSVTVNIPGLT